ncbi:EcsC family protein [Phenylobacterium sp.]|jgi:hypothetical protein|uniref:EcsC family protein n=1 Tax=Phenylobacterium sp. TaxID=1871053 RepID=UPI002F9322F1
MAATPPFGIAEPAYQDWARGEVAHWRAEMLRPPGVFDRAAKGVQSRINRVIPEAVHDAVTRVIEQMTRGMLVGADWTTAAPMMDAPLSVRDARAREVIATYRTTAAVEGGVAGAGGFWLAAADFPALIAIKIKLLFDLAGVYGRSGQDFAERLFLLHVFQLAFSSPTRRAEVFHLLQDWDAREHPHGLDEFDWRTFQQEYRDYIDLAKLAQLIPLVGAPIGAMVNWRLTERVGDYAVNAYRMRWLG